MKKNGPWRSYIIAVTVSIGAAIITWLIHDLWKGHPAVEIGILTILFLSAYFAARRLYAVQQEKRTDLLPEQIADHPTIETAKSNTLSPLAKKTSTPKDIQTRDWKLEDTRLVLITSDRSDRHRILAHLAGWKTQVKVCSNTVRAITEILSASDNNTPYHTVIVDQRQLDMEPVQFANSIRSEPSLQNLSLIYLGPENSPDRDQQLAAAGYSHILLTPINKSLLYNALHSTTNARQHSSQNVVSFIHHYRREQSSLPPLDILVAASPAHLKRIQNILKKTRHQAFAVENGEQALNALDSYNFDLAIFELEMPIINGIEAIKLYHFTHQNSLRMPFMLFIPEPGSQIINHCNGLDIDACLIGEIQHHTLIAAIKQAVADCNRRPPSTKPDQKIKAEDVNQHSSAILGRATLRDLEALGSGQEFVNNLINSFLLSSEELLDDMERAIAENRYQAFIDHALAFKDSAGNLGALAVYKASIKASHLDTTGFKESASLLTDEIRISFNKTRKALLDYMAEQNHTMHGH
ncbi:MAG: response regulator [Candidatus Polarisedimenticolaceae bacterium]|nr:response regulator [Candidatus Polarisedimenticolaceae bacterium]